MNYPASVSDFFKSPKWMMNLLLAGLCALIPLIGQIVLKGWLITGFWGRDDDRYENFPDFDFNNFVKYLERGIWPFLVTLVSGLALGFLCAFVLLPLGMITSLVAGGSHDQSCVGAFMALIMMFVYFIMVAGIFCVLSPLVLRASITQDFAQAFNFTFVKRFLALTWKELLISSLFCVVAAVVLSGVGFVLLCIGIYFATVLVYFCWMHLQKQLYNLYLSRGGEPVPFSPKLRDFAAPATPPV
jgi:hypothetical protein